MHPCTISRSPKNRTLRIKRIYQYLLRGYVMDAPVTDKRPVALVTSSLSIFGMSGLPGMICTEEKSANIRGAAVVAIVDV